MALNTDTVPWNNDRQATLLHMQLKINKWLKY